MSIQIKHNHSNPKLSFYLVEQQNEVQGKCKEQSQKTQVVEVSREVVLEKREKYFYKLINELVTLELFQQINSE